MKAAAEKPLSPVADTKRLTRGSAYGAEISTAAATADDWPTFRADAARHGSTKTRVDANVTVAWTTTLGGKLTSPVAVGDRVYVAQIDAHTLHAMDVTDGKEAWRFVAGGRIDSPPTIHQGRVLVGSRDGYVYCLRASDGALVWRFLAAPRDHRVGCFDQIESAWPVHGSVLVWRGVAYVTAGRSTYVDGGIRLWGLDPATGEIRHKGLLSGPQPDTAKGERDVAFYITGANCDVLVAEGDFLYMRQKKLTPDLKEVDVPVISSKGGQNVGSHVFSTAGLLDGSWYNRTFWMYSKRWPGFQLANQSPKAGQLLVVDDKQTYAVRVFYRRNGHSPMFFPGKEGYLVFADRNDNEPQIVGEKGSREPLRWLPQSDWALARGGNRKGLLTQKAWGGDKGVGYTRAEPAAWMAWQPVRIRGMVKAGDNLFIAGEPDVFDPDDPYAAFEGRKGASVVTLSAATGKRLSETELARPPVFDGMIAAAGRLFIATTDGAVVCMQAKGNQDGP